MASLESYTHPYLLGAMDRLWFQKTVLISEPICPNKSPPLTKNTPNSSPKSQSSSSLYSAPTDCSDDIITEDFSHGVHHLLPNTAFTTPQSDSEHEDDKKERLEEEKGEENSKEVRPTRPNPIMKKTKASSTPIRRRTRTRMRLERTRSCKSSAELEEEEVKGFMDLGFIFDKDRLTPKMMSMIPGLQRLEGEADENEDVEIVGEEERRRPYLSEAWLIRRPESPIVMTGMPVINAASDDMKKQLKLWAKTVASSAVEYA